MVVATWARTHEELVEQALQAGTHVLVEKPFTSTLDSARRLLELAAARDRKIAVVQQWRYLPGQRTMRRLLRDIAAGKALGDVTTLADPSIVAKLREQYEEKEG